MKKRIWKIAGLVMGGGVLLQAAAGCDAALTQQVTSLIVNQIVAIIIQSVLAGAPIA